jgi:hypothetical protein
MRRLLFRTDHISLGAVSHWFEIWLTTSLAIGISVQPADYLFRDTLVLHFLALEIRIDKEMPEHCESVQCDSIWHGLIALCGGAFVGEYAAYFRCQQDLEHYLWLLRDYAHISATPLEQEEGGDDEY